MSAVEGINPAQESYSNVLPKRRETAFCAERWENGLRDYFCTNDEFSGEAVNNGYR